MYPNIFQVYQVNDLPKNIDRLLRYIYVCIYTETKPEKVLLLMFLSQLLLFLPGLLNSLVSNPEKNVLSDGVETSFSLL